MGTRIARAALAALTLGLLLADAAVAQVGPDADVYVFGRRDPDRYLYDRPRRPPPPPPDEDWPRRPPPPPRFDDEDQPRYLELDRDERPRWGGSICYTARGTCLTRPGPPNAPCGCAIPGFGWKRGQIGD
jgi:hypothetical protein